MSRHDHLIETLIQFWVLKEYQQRQQAAEQKKETCHAKNSFVKIGLHSAKQ